jgi:hypothetical protein
MFYVCLIVIKEKKISNKMYVENVENFERELIGKAKRFLILIGDVEKRGKKGQKNVVQMSIFRNEVGKAKVM